MFTFLPQFRYSANNFYVFFDISKTLRYTVEIFQNRSDIRFSLSKHNFKMIINVINTKYFIIVISLSWSKYHGKWVYSWKEPENTSSNHATETHAMKNCLRNGFISLSRNYNVSDVVSISNDKQHAKNNSTLSKRIIRVSAFKQVFL